MGITGTVSDMANIRDVQGSEALILALNKLLGTAPARAVQGRVGVPFVIESDPGITANAPSNTAYEQAVEIMKGAKIPANASQVDKVSALTKYMQQLGIPLQ
jgi:hypothetical protein